MFHIVEDDYQVEGWPSAHWLFQAGNQVFGAKCLTAHPNALDYGRPSPPVEQETHIHLGPADAGFPWHTNKIDYRTIL